MRGSRHRILVVLICLVVTLEGSASAFAEEGSTTAGYAVKMSEGELGLEDADLPADGEQPEGQEPSKDDENPTEGKETPKDEEQPEGQEQPKEEEEQPPEEEEQPEEPVVLAVTKITGVPEKVSRNASDELSFTVKVKPANGGRVVKLQQYDSAKKKWKTRATYNSEDKKKATVKVLIAGKYRKKTTGKWRVVAPATDRAKRAVSKTCTVTSRNVTTKKLAAKSACVYCIDDGRVLYTKKSKTKRLPASTTKLMTAVLLVESGKLHSKTKVSAYAASTPWSYGRLQAGDKYRTYDLFYAVMLPSSNAAATAVAEKVSGSTAKFVKKMNKKAKKIGMTDTNFCNPHGLHQSGHYTTALDLAKLTAYAYGKDEIRKAMGTSTRTIKSLRYKRQWTLYSTDVLLGKIKNFFGGKTGTSPEAKYCFTGVYKYKDKTYVTVVLNAGTADGRWNDTKKLQSYIRDYAETSY